ncbi:MAG: intradiol ring-cleavage dioxygenase [Saprospiraceae bacterium]|nr:intradiol ring-cleavage dioxygenase [Saprospiraceae bacterium]
MKSIMLILCSIFVILNACTQSPAQSNKADKKVGGPCEGCEAIYEYGNKKLSSVDTLPDFFDKGPKLKITGTIYKKDGKTPAKDVILYIYHTDQTGVYPTKGNEKGWAKRHGYIRGWIKTGTDGKYTFYTLRPASYPNSRNPQHIHPTIKEPGKSEYYIDEFLFDDDPYLTAEQRKHGQNRGGNGILKTTKFGDMQIAQHDIILGLNIPNYD